ncbi:MAG: lipid-binding SYLF domain-containing protein [Thermodesulfobacteriota bacterium]
MNLTISFPGRKALIVALTCALSWMVSPLSPARAEDDQGTRLLVDRAKITMDSFMAARDLLSMRNLLRQAKGVFIGPQVLKGAFIIGGSGGSGVLLVHDPKTGRWNGPAFYTMGEASFGLQIGGETAEILLLAMTDRGVTAFLGNSVKLGADVGVAAGPVGVGVDASTANLSADIITYSRAKGLYGGISLEGAVVAVRHGWNEAYYGKRVTPTDILVRGDAKNEHAAGLLDAVSKAASKKTKN